MHVLTRLIQVPNLFELRQMAAGLIPHLKWRANGLGLLQAYITEGDGSELRMHIWDPTLRRDGIQGNGNAHDHRFDMRATVLHGSVRHDEIELTESEVGEWATFPVTHARQALAKHGTFDSSVSHDGKRYDREICHHRILVGTQYQLPKFRFHCAETDELAITLVAKSAQSTDKARILAPAGSTPVHAFGEELSMGVWLPTLDKARKALFGDPSAV